MASISLAAWGILLMILNGMLNSTLATSGKLLQQAAWPYFKMMAISDLALSMGIVVCSIFGKVALPDVRQATWLLLRGLFGAASMLLLILSVRVGASPGDAAALGSVNTILAAIFGRVFLGEKLQLVHGVAVCFAVAGGILIAKPEFLFGGSANGSSALPGYALAGASGFAKAAVFIAARKCQNSSAWMLNLSPAICCTLAFAALPFTPVVQEPPLGGIHVPLSIPIFAVLLVVHAMGMGTQSTASKCCPAAVGATANTGAAMISGYIIQTFLFEKAPEAISICGAVLMFASVIIMALARVPGRHTADLEFEEATGESGTLGHRGQIAEDNDETESLASFIAAEFVEVAAHDKTVRQRRPAANAGLHPPSQTIGVAMAVVAAAA